MACGLHVGRLASNVHWSAWARAVRDPAHVEWLRTQGMVWPSRVDLDAINTLAPQVTRLGDALTALAAAALTLLSAYELMCRSAYEVICR